MYKDLSENEWEKQPTSKVKTFRSPKNDDSLALLLFDCLEKYKSWPEHLVSLTWFFSDMLLDLSDILQVSFTMPILDDWFICFCFCFHIISEFFGL